MTYIGNTRKEKTKPENQKKHKVDYRGCQGPGLEGRGLSVEN